MSADECERREIRSERKRPPRQKRNPIEAAISHWYENHAVHLENPPDVSELIAQAPKRWTAYGPLVLLPAGSFTSPIWRRVLGTAATSFTDSADRNANTDRDEESPGGPALLWKKILDEISGSPKAKLTHLAINEGIPLHSRDGSEGAGTESGGGGTGESENILRSPSGLRMLYGDFGPSTVSPLRGVTEADFARAFWVSTKQNGITQTWAPRWTMFSRGNVKEKARLLGFHDAAAAAAAADERRDPGGRVDDVPSPPPNVRRAVVSVGRRRAGRALAVDLYAGIGYFAFCYAALGFRVLCWELNPWSVEGLRRGALANGWSVRVVVPPPAPRGDDDELLADILAGGETIIVFLEDNTRAAGRIAKLDELTRRRETTEVGCEKVESSPGAVLRMSSIMHVNCGLLPSSQGSWATAWEIASAAPRVWLHVHENVGVSDIDVKREEIRQWFAERAAERGSAADICVEHVELVKTFAPGVWHCVFDLYIGRQDTDTRDTGNIT
ncbi:S-adenosyl-L-methionine-dependent methyltransferase [Xylaria palmicola]|nr:S-adenosyl-L-methionine-dependent methyltransferase [Xylaria palmicola]